MSTPTWYQKLLRDCNKPGELTDVRLTTIREHLEETIFREDTFGDIHPKTEKVLVQTTIAYWSPTPGRVEYGAHRSIDKHDKKMRRVIAVGRLFKCPLVIKNAEPRRKTVRAVVQERNKAGHPLRGARRHTIPAKDPFVVIPKPTTVPIYSSRLETPMEVTVSA